MPEDSNLTTNRRIAASDDLEVSAYLEIAQELSGQRLDQSEPIEAHQETLLVLDFGSQYSRLIARRIREAHVYCEIIPHDAPWETVADLNPKGIILSGGPASVYEADAPLAPAWVFESGLPVLGICYGMQAMVHQLGGKVTPGQKQEYGSALLHQNGARAGSDNPLFHGMPPSFQVWMSHGDRVEDLPPGSATLAYTENSPVAALQISENIFGLQFHPEVKIGRAHV